MRIVLYYFFKVYVKTGLFFYSKKIRVSGTENIPKKDAVLFASNHPNGLVDPLFIATNIKRKTHFLVRAAVFNNPIVAKFFDLLGMMPVYRIRDGIQQLSKNEEIFNKCEELLKNNKALLIFPEGSHCKDRTIRPLSKGFTRIIFRTLDNNPATKIHIVPIGITYQNVSNYPSKVAINFGKPILANDFYDKKEVNNSVKVLKELVSNQLEQLSVHIINDESYHSNLSELNNAQIDYTQVEKVNSLINNNNFLKEKKRSKNYAFPIYCLVVLNSFIPFILWKIMSKKVNETEFIDTFRFGVNAVLFPLFYSIQSWIVSYVFDNTIALLYFAFSLLLVLLYTKTAVTPPSE